jgi:cell division septation protein DedD
MVVCARLLIWGALGALVTLMYVKNSDVPAPIRRQLLPARPGAAGPAAVALGEPVTIWPSDVARADAAKREAVARPDPPGRPASAGASPARPAASRVPGHRAYWVQVGAFRNRDEARRLASRLRDAPVVVVEAGPAGSRLAKVRIGPFPDRPAALAKLRQLQGQGFGAFLAEALD